MTRNFAKLRPTAALQRELFGPKADRLPEQQDQLNQLPPT
jgi:hypothetical protein